MRADLPRSSPRSALVRLLGSLDTPFTLVRSEMNGLLDYGPCWFYENGMCGKGVDCIYKHGEEDGATKIPSHKGVAPPSCWYYEAGWCGNGSECPFRHAPIAGDAQPTNGADC